MPTQIPPYANLDISNRLTIVLPTSTKAPPNIPISVPLSLNTHSILTRNKTKNNPNLALQATYAKPIAKP